MEPWANSGFWESLGQKEEVTVEWGDNNSVILRELTGFTTLKGTLRAFDHTISGTVIRGNEEGGYFQLVTRDDLESVMRSKVPAFCRLAHCLFGWLTVFVAGSVHLWLAHCVCGWLSASLAGSLYLWLAHCICG